MSPKSFIIPLPHATFVTYCMWVTSALAEPIVLYVQTKCKKSHLSYLTTKLSALVHICASPLLYSCILLTSCLVVFDSFLVVFVYFLVVVVSFLIFFESFLDVFVAFLTCIVLLASAVLILSGIQIALVSFTAFMYLVIQQQQIINKFPGNCRY